MHRAQQLGQDFDFVFLEAALPEVDGWKTARMLGALELPQAPHVVVLSEEAGAVEAAPSAVKRVLPPHASASTVWDAMAACLALDGPHAVPVAADAAAGATSATATPVGRVADAASEAIDLDEGLRLCGGKTDVYRHLLQQFDDVHEQTLTQLSSGDLPSVLRALHLLISQAQALGAHRLQDLSAGVEQHLAAWGDEVAGEGLQARVHEVVQEMNRVCEALPALRDRLSPALPLGEDAGDATADATNSALAALEQALESGDVEALNLVAQNQARLQRGLGGRMAELQEALARYDFDAALAVLRQEGKPGD
mgnify:CR=1 FL=1